MHDDLLSVPLRREGPKEFFGGSNCAIKILNLEMREAFIGGSEDHAEMREVQAYESPSMDYVWACATLRAEHVA